MDVTLQKHGAKHIYKVPEGLRELCTDISREVLRSQPRNIYGFIAEYCDMLLITRENTKVAVKVVNNILLGSQAILSILYRNGFSLEQIAVAAPRIQTAFRDYLDAVDMQPIQICGDDTCDEKSALSIRSILQSTGATHDEAERAATIIQAAFRGHYERMVLNQAQGKIQWQKAVTNTLDILKRAGATQSEILKASRHIQYAYRGYYARRNQKIDSMDEGEEEKKEKEKQVLQPSQAIQAVAWMEMMYEDSGISVEKANDAALVIQRAFKKYRVRRGCYDVQRVESTKSMVVEAVLENLRHKLFEKVMSREDIPGEYGSREDMMIAGAKLQIAFKEHLRQTRITEEGRLEVCETDETGESCEDEDTEEMGTTTRSPESDTMPLDSERKSEVGHLEEQSLEPQTDDEQETTSESDVKSEPEVARQCSQENVSDDETAAQETAGNEDTQVQRED